MISYLSSTSFSLLFFSTDDELDAFRDYIFINSIKYLSLKNILQNKIYRFKILQILSIKFRDSLFIIKNLLIYAIYLLFNQKIDIFIMTKNT